MTRIQLTQRVANSNLRVPTATRVETHHCHYSQTFTLFILHNNDVKNQDSKLKAKTQPADSGLQKPLQKICSNF